MYRGGGDWWAVNLVWEIWRFNLATKCPTPITLTHDP